MKMKMKLSKIAFCCLFLNAFLLYAQGNITGSVTDAETGTPLPGVTIVEQGTTNGVSSDFDGNFIIAVNNDAILSFSYIGFETQQVTVNGDQISVSLIPLTNFLDEIVVTGYGAQKRREITGSIVTINSESIERIATGSSIDAIKGQVAGVDISSSGGRPGQAPQVRIRGRRSISASNDPLYVVDGIPITSGGASGAVFDINPQDIQSMEILKDAAATAVYGSRGANGVILITTKRGKAGETTVSYSGYYGVSEVMNVPQMMDGDEYATMRYEAYRQDGSGAFTYSGSLPTDPFYVFDGEQALVDNFKAGKSTNYLDEVLQQGFQTNHQISANGGSEDTRFNVSLGYFNEEGVVPGMDYERFTGRLNLDSRINDNFKFGFSMTLSNSENNWGSNAVMGEALRNIPLGNPYDANGNPNFNTWNDGIASNPLSEIVPGAYYDERKATRIFAPVYVTINLTPELEFTSTFGPDLRFSRRGEFRGSATNDNRLGPADAELKNEMEFGFTLENLFTYNQKIGPGNMKVTLLQSIQQYSSEFGKAEVLNLPYESQLWHNIGTAEVKGNMSSGLTEWALQSYMGRVNYEIDGKYLFQASMRADGSSRLSAGNKWAYFPGISAGWRLSEESFLQDSRFDELKLRVSYGEVGNTAINPYQTLGGLGRTVYSYGDAAAFGFKLQDIPNADLGWEISKTFDIGLDYSILDGRVNGALDYYITNTTDLLLSRNLPYTSGYSSVFQNIGATKTNGLEFNVNASVIENEGGFNFDIGFNISGYSEKIMELALKDASGNPLDDTGNNWFIGQPIRVFFDYQKEGIYQTGEAALAQTLEGKDPGEIKLLDKNGDGKITPDDRHILGTDIPDYFGGLTTNFSYGNWDLNAFIYFRQGQMISSQFHTSNNSLFGRYNNLSVDYWTPNNPTNEYPRPTISQERPENYTTMSYFDGSYVKLRNLTLGYNVDQDQAAKIGMSSLRLYVQGQNLGFISDFETFDPEIGEFNLSSGIAPSSSLWAVGIKANF
jgi:TonB-linked SusC/RagA family outer membrane protein